MRTKTLFALGVCACILIYIYMYIWPGFYAVNVFNTELVLVEDARTEYQHRSGYNCAKPNFTRMDRSPYHFPREVDESKFTVVILTHNRTEIMLQTVKHYSKMERVDAIVVLWNNQGVDPPAIQETSKSKVPIVVKILEENKLRLRFQPLTDVRTQALFNVDDDILVDEDDLNRAFEVWKLNPYTAVGFFAKAHSQPLFSWCKYSYKTRKIHGAAYSIVLADVAFLHSEYFRLYTDTISEGMARLVDKFSNCEDIALSFLMSDFCQCASGLHVKPRFEIQHLGEKSGLSGRSNHYLDRGVCISTFARYFDEMPLKHINCVYG